MTTDPLAEVLAKHYANRYDERGGGVYGCRCGDASGTVREHVAHQADAVRSFLSEHVAKPEVVEAVADAVMHTPADHEPEFYWSAARAALAVLLTTLGGESNE